MSEPPQPGFTGVVWEAREPDRLTRELFAGPGVTPMAEAGAGWTRLSAAFGAAVVEYEQIVAGLRGAWQSDTSAEVLDRVSRLRDWLVDTAGAARGNAGRAATQAAAHELARLAMPHAAEIAALQAAQQMLEQVTGALGAPLRAVAADTETRVDLAKASATRVMRTYEAATEPLATPWLQQEPPVIATKVALEAEQSAASASEAGATATSAGMPMVFTPPVLPGALSVPRAQTAYRAPVYAQAGETVEAVTPRPTTAATVDAPTAVPVVPGAMAAGTPAAIAADEEHVPRAGDAGADRLGADLGVVSAPAVLGAPEPPAPTSARTETGGAA
ncbi:PPE domain-containing protein [Nocardia bovistercoris]|uniref:PPE domain-containing protein n=1 Tax=Nocardia bovistercoris TaxID=2785916 RepID=A0A931I9Z3_9NOCA|nr:PPE domain-containing protein [Nocardia bovistercoris]MBH0777584.1 PPE domain-containing protein [Nocardia bovistercoris]